MSERNYRQPPPDRDGDSHDSHNGHDGNDNEDQGHNVHDERELVHYVHEMLRSLEAITAGRALMPLSRSIGAAKDLAHSILIHG